MDLEDQRVTKMTMQCEELFQIPFLQLRKTMQRTYSVSIIIFSCAFIKVRSLTLSFVICWIIPAKSHVYIDVTHWNVLLYGGVWIDTEKIPWMLHLQRAKIILAEPATNPGVLSLVQILGIM